MPGTHLRVSDILPLLLPSALKSPSTDTVY